MDKTEPEFTNKLCAIQKCIYNCLMDYEHNVSREKAEYLLKSLEEQGYELKKIKE